MNTCEDHQTAYLEGEPRAADHVRSCPSCQTIAAELDDVRQFLASPAAWLDPDPGLEARVIGAVAAAAAPVVEAAAPVAVKTRGLARRRRWFVVARPAFAFAAAALLVGGLVGGAIMRTVSGGPRADLHVAMAGTELAPRARADAAVRVAANGVEVRLRVSHLPRAPAGYYYQAWVKGEKGLVPIGTFHTGNGEVVLWSGVPLNGYPTITVTLEDEGGDPGSSGRRVLTGHLPTH